MSELYYGTINIGGRLPRSKLFDFCEAIAEDYVIDLSRVDSLNFPDIVSTEELKDRLYSLKTNGGSVDIPLASNKNNRLNISDREAAYGQFPKIEKWCMQHGLSFKRFTSADTATSALRVQYDASQNIFRKFPTTDNDMLLLSFESISQAINYLDSLTDTSVALEIGRRTSKELTVLYTSLLKNGFNKYETLKDWVQYVKADFTLPPLVIA